MATTAASADSSSPPSYRRDSVTVSNGDLDVHRSAKRLYPFADDYTAKSERSKRSRRATGALELDTLVVGASWAGIWALHRLQSLGLRVKLVDACSDVGGVWYYTRYPGCRVDTEIPVYEFTKPELWQKWNWSERFPCREEIHRYLCWVCNELDLRKDIVQDTRVTSCTWDERQSRWAVQGSEGFAATAQFLIPCAGYSTIRYIPDFPGLESFKNSLHTSDWPEGFDCRGRRIGVIGTAASGIQVIENLAKECEHLTVFQRTPNLATPMRQKQYSKTEVIKIKQQYPHRFAARRSAFGFDGKIARSSSADSALEREKTFERLWERGGLSFWFGGYEDTLNDPIANIQAYNFWRRKVRERINDRDNVVAFRCELSVVQLLDRRLSQAEILAPIKPPHAFGTKRPSLETAYFEVFNQPNVDLVDLNSDPIVSVEPEGIRTASGEFHKLDVLALATGFDFLTGSMLAMGIRGRHGRKLNDYWDLTPEGPGVRTHLGLISAGFPNLLFPMGPQAPSALGLTPHMAEIQGDWVADLIVWMREHGHSAVEPSTKAEDQWKAEVARAARETLFGGTSSWYMGTNIPNRKKQPLCYFGGVDTYMSRLEESAAQAYPGLQFSG